MTTSITDETSTATASATGEQPKLTKKGRVAPRRGNVAPAKTKSGRRATPAKKAPKDPKKAQVVRDGSKTAKILDLLKRPGGATSKELVKATSWQAHSLRGFLSGVLGKKMGLAVTSTKGDDGERSYSVKG